MSKMKVLVVGGGAREHALAWKLSQSSLVEKIFVAPGNPGLDVITELVPLKADDVGGLVRFAKKEGIGLTVIGPEAPLALGLADRLAEEGLTAFGPTAAAARLESSKTFAKAFMRRHHIPTAAYEHFTSAPEALAYLGAKPDGPIVVKASGLAQGKGVTVASGRAEAMAAVREAMEAKRFGEAGSEVVIEDFIEGEEVTVLAFTDGETVALMPPVQDHKAAYDGDQGPNTGGMGAYSPVAAYTKEIAALTDETIIRPTLAGLAAEGLRYRGCLYFGLMLPAPGSPYHGPQVIEYNARFGDPETEVLMLLLKSDLAKIMLDVAEGHLAGGSIEWRDESAVCVVLTSRGYPGAYEKGHVITEDVVSFAGASMIFHAGTALNDRGELVTSGGRVLTVAAKSTRLEKALDKVYNRARAIHFEGCHYRADIAHRELERRGQK